MTGRARILYGVLGEVEARLLGAIGCTQVTWLEAAELAVAIRTGFEPGDAPALADAAIHHAHDDHDRRRCPGGRRRTDPCGHRAAGLPPRRLAVVTATILLPRKGAVMGALARALVPSQIGERRSLTVFYRPVGPGAADRSTGRAEMSAAMAAEMRRKVGRVERARERRAGHSCARPTRSSNADGPWSRSPRRSPSPSPPPGTPRTTAAASTPRSGCAATPPCPSTAPTTPRSPPPPSRSASGCPANAAR